MKLKRWQIAVCAAVAVLVVVVVILTYRKLSPRPPAGGIRVEVSWARIEELTRDLQAVLMEGRVIPQLDDQGKMQCLKFVEFKSGGLFEYLGLVPGDCVQSVNNENLSSPMSAMLFYGSLTKGRDFMLSIERGGRVIPVQIVITP